MNSFKCPACKTLMQEGTTDIVMRREKSIVVIEDIPALVCPQCSEASIEKEVAQMAYALAEQEINRGVSLEFCKYRAA